MKSLFIVLLCAIYLVPSADAIPRKGEASAYRGKSALKPIEHQFALLIRSGSAKYTNQHFRSYNYYYGNVSIPDETTSGWKGISLEYSQLQPEKRFFFFPSFGFSTFFHSTKGLDGTVNDKKRLYQLHGGVNVGVNMPLKGNGIVARLAPYGFGGLAWYLTDENPGASSGVIHFGQIALDIGAGIRYHLPRSPRLSAGLQANYVHGLLDIGVASDDTSLKHFGAKDYSKILLRAFNFGLVFAYRVG